MPDMYSTPDNATVTDALWTWGWWLVLLASGLALGLIIGAESTKVVIVQADAFTPGLFGPNVAVGWGYLRWWEASKAMAIVGGGAMLGAYLWDEFYDSSAA